MQRFSLVSSRVLASQSSEFFLCRALGNRHARDLQKTKTENLLFEIYACIRRVKEMWYLFFKLCFAFSLKSVHTCCYAGLLPCGHETLGVGNAGRKKFPLKWRKIIFLTFHVFAGKTFFANEIFLWCPLGKEKKNYCRKKNSLKAVQNHFFDILNNFWKKNFLHKFFFSSFDHPLAKKKNFFLSKKIKSQKCFPKSFFLHFESL